MSDYLFRSKNYDKEISVDNLCSQYQGSRRFYQQNNNERQELQLDNGNSTTSTAIDVGNNTFFGELERLLSTQVQILNIAKQNALKVKGSCGNPQRQHNEVKAKSLAAANVTANKNVMASVLPTSGINNLENCGNIIEPNNNIAVDMPYTQNTFPINYLPDVHVPQHVQQYIPMTEMYNNHDTVPSTFIHARGQIDEKVLQKKAAHNKIEKRRRSFINDKIAELQSLLPEDVNRTVCTNKGSILKESVDYIKKLQSDFAVIKQLKERISEIDLESKQMAMRLEMLEKRTKANPGSTNIDQNKTPALGDATYLSLDSVMTERLPKVLPTMSQTMDFDDILDTFASACKDS